MCGTLRHNSIKFQLGAQVPIDSDEHVTPGRWQGHARSETLEQWTGKGWKAGHIAAAAYTEGHGEQQTWFKVPEGHSIKVVYNPSLKHPQGGHPFNIVTRAASTPHEKSVHPRFPITEKK